MTQNTPAPIPVIDGHIDLPWQYFNRHNLDLDAIDLAGGTADLKPPMQTDIPRLRRGHCRAAFWAVYVPLTYTGDAMVTEALRQVDFIHRLCERYSDFMTLARTADDIERAWAAGRFASLIGIEGGQLINNSLDTLREFSARGARYMTLTYSKNNDWADSCTDEPLHNGITDFGREVVHEMNRLGMIPDLSHTSPATMRAVLDVSAGPVIASHSGAAARLDHPRNLPDDILRRIANNGGVAQVCFVPYFLNHAVMKFDEVVTAKRNELKAEFGEDRKLWEPHLEAWLVDNPPALATLGDIADHIEHVRAIAGIDHVGLGSDFEGFGRYSPIGMEDVSCYPNLLEELRHRGWSESDLAKLAHQNILRVLREAEAAAQ